MPFPVDALPGLLCGTASACGLSLIHIYLAIVALCLLLGFMLGRKSKYEKREYLKQFKIGKATYSESLIYEAYGGLQNDGIMLAVYYDVDAAKIIPVSYTHLLPCSSIARSVSRM